MACVEVSNIHMGCEDACALEETGEFQARAAKRHTSKRGDRPRAEGRGERRDWKDERLDRLNMGASISLSLTPFLLMLK